MSFRADELERQLSEQILYAVSPAGVTAAALAAQRLGAERQARRQMLEDELKQARYEADLTRRRFDHVDPANRLVFDTLTQELETALVAVQEHEDKLQAFDQREPERPTPGQRAELEHLGISPMSVHRLVEGGILPAERHPGLPSVVKRSHLRTPAVKRAVARIQSHGHGRLPDDPNQLDLFPWLDS